MARSYEVTLITDSAGIDHAEHHLFTECGLTTFRPQFLGAPTRRAQNTEITCEKCTAALTARWARRRSRRVTPLGAVMRQGSSPAEPTSNERERREMASDAPYQELDEWDHENHSFTFVNLHPLNKLIDELSPQRDKSRADKKTNAGRDFVYRLKIGSIEVMRTDTYAPDDDVIPWLTTYTIKNQTYLDVVEAWQALTGKPDGRSYVARED